MKLCILVGLFTVVFGKAAAVKSSTDAVINAIMKGEKAGESRIDIFHEECSFVDEDKQECGKRTYDERECMARGCCWQPCEGCQRNVPWCFLAHRMLRSECDVAYEMKDDCGYYGITEGECYIRGCCWAPSPLVNSPPCFKKGRTLDVRLADGDESSGRVEVLHDGQWGTVCDDSFDAEEASVVCKSLGFDDSVMMVYISQGSPRVETHFGQGSGRIWMDGLSCDGDEQSLTECDHNGWGEHDCSHSEDAVVACFSGDQSSESESGELRLVNGDDEGEGRLEVFHNGEWGTICDDQFNDEEALVACRSLGYRHGAYFGGAHFGEGGGRIWLDSVNCSGEEDSLTECSHDDWGSNDCGHSEDVGVACRDPIEGISGSGSGYDQE